MTNTMYFGEEEPGQEYWYRYADYRVGGDEYTYGSHAELGLRTYRVVKTTPKGVWLELSYGSHKFVLRDARKRWACPTKEEALDSFIARKNRQIGLLCAQLDHAEEALTLAREKRQGNVGLPVSRMERKLI